MSPASNPFSDTPWLPRQDPPLVGGERESLVAWLDYHRSTLAMKCADLTPAELAARSVPPSTMSLIGLVRHMAEVERNWFQRMLAGRADEGAGRIYGRAESPDAEFDDVDEAAIDDGFVTEALATWQAECTASDRVLAGLGLDDTGVEAERGEISVRWVLVHMIEEYARHNGHADLLRERIDGVTGD